MKHLSDARHNLIVAIGCYGWQLVQDTATHRMWLRKDGQRKSAGRWDRVIVPLSRADWIYPLPPAQQTEPGITLYTTSPIVQLYLDHHPCSDAHP